jgi:hypothetical protein
MSDVAVAQRAELRGALAEALRANGVDPAKAMPMTMTLSKGFDKIMADLSISQEDVFGDLRAIREGCEGGLADTPARSTLAPLITKTERRKAIAEFLDENPALRGGELTLAIQQEFGFSRDMTLTDIQAIRKGQPDV